MAAELVELQAALGRMGMEPAVATLITDAQGLDTLEEFTNLTDTEVENLCKVIRRPGGTVPNPQAGAARQPPTINDPKHAILLRAENNLKLMGYFLKYRQQTSRMVEAADLLTMYNVRGLRNLKEQEIARTDVDPPKMNSKNWPLTIEAMEEWLRGCLGGCHQDPISLCDPTGRDHPTG
jgi:hypothetical protein